MEMLIVIGLVTAVIGGTFGYFAGLGRSGKTFGAACAVLAALTGLMFYLMDQSSGWDGLIYLIGLMVGIAPAAGGGAPAVRKGGALPHRPAASPEVFTKQRQG